MRTILVAVDGSASGNRAVECAVDMVRRQNDSKLLLLLNVQYAQERGNTGSLLSADWREQLHKAAQEDAAVARELADKAQLNHEFLVMFGQPAEVITRMGGERGCCGIVMGTRGLGNWANVFLGSTACKVVQQSTLPVTLVH